MNPEAPAFQPEKNFDKCNTIKAVSTLNVHHNANIKVNSESKWLSLEDVTYHFPQATGDVDQRWCISSSFNVILDSRAVLSDGGGTVWEKNFSGSSEIYNDEHVPRPFANMVQTSPASR